MSLADMPPTASAHSGAASPMAAAGPASRPALRPPKKRARALATAMVWGSVIFVAALVGALVIVRFSRRFRGWMVRQPKVPTPSDDVWSMHRPPADSDDGELDDRH